MVQLKNKELLMMEILLSQHMRDGIFVYFVFGIFTIIMEL